MNTPPDPQVLPAIPKALQSKWQRIVHLMKNVMQVDVGLMMRLDENVIEVCTLSGIAEGGFQLGQRLPVHNRNYCDAVLKTGAPVIIANAGKDPQWRESVAAKNGLVYYQGYPLHWPDQTLFGTLCIFDRHENAPATEKQEVMLDFAFMVESDLQQLQETTQHLAERRQLARQEAELSALFQNAHHAITVVSKRHFVMVNPALVSLFGYENESDIVGRPVSDLIAPEERAKIDRIQTGRAQGHTLPLAYQSKGLREDGSLFDMSIKISRYHLEGVDYTVGMVDDVTVANQTLKALRESDERYKSFVEQVSDGIYRLELDTPIALDQPPEEQARQIFELAYYAECNQALCDMYGFSAPEALVGSRLSDTINKPDPAEQIIGIQKTVESGYRIVDLQSMEIDQHGEEKYFNNNTIGITENGFLKRLWGTQTDITARKAAEEKVHASLYEKSILLKEIHHRVKNNLQVISSLLSLQANHCDDASVRDVFGQSRDRVRSMALVHEQLYQSKTFSKIEIGQYLRKLIKSLQFHHQASEKSVALHLSVEKVYLSIEKAIPCGLIANECITNVYKHAFPESHTEPGEMKITLRQLDKGTLELVVADNGVGLPRSFDNTGSQSLGIRLIRMLTEDQLDGTLDFVSECGTVVTIQFPIADRPPQAGRRLQA